MQVTIVFMSKRSDLKVIASWIPRSVLNITLVRVIAHTIASLLTTTLALAVGVSSRLPESPPRADVCILSFILGLEEGGVRELLLE